MSAVSPPPVDAAKRQLRNLSIVIDGYRQLGFEFEHFADVKLAIFAKIANLAQGVKDVTQNDVEVLRAALFEFSELEFDDNERQKIFQSLLDGFKTKNPYDAKNDNVTKLASQPYFSKFGDLVETLDYLLNPTDAQVKDLCIVVKAAKKKAANTPEVIAELDTLLDKFGCPEPDPDTKQKV